MSLPHASPHAARQIARVRVLSCNYHADRVYDYFIPDSLRSSIAAGDFVIVPFGGSNRRQTALVVELALSGQVPNLKPVQAMFDGAGRLDAEMLGLCAFLREQTLCSYGEAVRAILPGGVRTKLRDFYRPVRGAMDEFTIKSKINEKVQALYGYLLQRDGAPGDSVALKFGAESETALRSLEKLGLIEREAQARENIRTETEKIAHISGDTDRVEQYLTKTRKLSSEKQFAALQLLADAGEMELGELCGEAGCGEGVIEKLLQAELLWIERRERAGDAWARQTADAFADKGENEAAGRLDYTLSEHQQATLDTLGAQYLQHRASAALLYGVTGSGKTGVMKKLIDVVVADGRQVIMLVPEIALTPQAVGIFYAYYPGRVAVIHSALSQGERYLAWKRIRDGEVDLVIGTRSASFAPCAKLGLFIIDEEQEGSYKSEQSPKFHARDVARYRCAHSGAMLLLSSATPSLESYHKAKTGAYTLVELKERYGGAVLPDVIVADMREGEESAAGAYGARLQAELTQTLSHGEQAILFLNRRGYWSFMSCRACGHVLLCPNCSVSMKLHQPRNTDGQANGTLKCHWCGYSEPAPTKCPACGSEHIGHFGFGTQKCEEELAELFPKAVIERMDMDTTGTKRAYGEILGRMRRGLIDILLGTQMVANGHEFEAVTLVGVLSADMSLFVDDFRANERSFAQLTQVVGRAGRAGKKGRALIQTYNPEHEVITLAVAQDYAKFYEGEIIYRRAMNFPPFCDICVTQFSSQAEGEAVTAAERFAALLRAKLGELPEDARKRAPVQLFGPFQAGMYKVGGRFNMRMVIKCRWNRDTRALISGAYTAFAAKLPRSVTMGIDVNPTAL